MLDEPILAEPSLTAIIEPFLAESLLEALSGYTFDMGIPLHYEDSITKMGMGRIVFSTIELEIDKSYSFTTALTDDTSGEVSITRFSSNEIQMQFRNCPDTMFKPQKKKKAKVTNTTEFVINVIINNFYIFNLLFFCRKKMRNQVIK